MPKELDFKFDVKAIRPRDIRDTFDRRVSDIDRKRLAEKSKVKVGYHFGLEIPYEAEKERFEAVAFVAKYIDENIDKITEAAKGPVDDLWSESLEQAKEAYEAQKEKADVQQLSPTALDQARDRLREMIKRTIKKKLMELIQEKTMKVTL